MRDGNPIRISLSLTYSFFLSLPRRTKDEEKHEEEENRERRRQKPNALYYLRIHIGRRRGERQTHSLRSRWRKNERIQRRRTTLTTNFTPVSARARAETGTHTYIYYNIYTYKHSRCSAVSPDEPRGLERSPKNRERMYKHTRRSRTHMHSHRSNIAPLQRDLLQRAVSRHRSLSGVAKTFSVSRHLGSVSRITSYRLELLAFTEPTFAPSTAHNAATIATTTTTTTTTTTITTTTTLPPILPTTPLLGWARGWRDSCICQDDSSLKGNIGAIAAYAVSSLEFVR